MLVRPYLGSRGMTPICKIVASYTQVHRVYAHLQLCKTPGRKTEIPTLQWEGLVQRNTLYLGSRGLIPISKIVASYKQVHWVYAHLQLYKTQGRKTEIPRLQIPTPDRLQIPTPDKLTM